MSSGLNATADACAADLSDFCTKIVSNPDITGIGVRTAIYVQTVLNMIIPSLFPSNLQIIRDTARATYVLSISLIAASIGQWKTQGLSLLDAIVVTMLATMMTAFATVNRDFIKTLGLSVNIVSALFFVFWTYWGFQIWLDPWTFGLQLPEGETNITSIFECTANLQTEFVIVGKSIPATNNGLRIFALIVFGITIIPTLGAVWNAFIWLIKIRVHGGELEARYAETYRNAKRRTYKIGAGAGKTEINGMGGFVGLVYMIVTIEQMIRRNRVAGEVAKWSFGQTLAVIMLLQQLFDIGSWLKNMVRHKREMEARYGKTSPSTSEGDVQDKGTDSPA